MLLLNLDILFKFSAQMASILYTSLAIFTETYKRVTDHC